MILLARKVLDGRSDQLCFGAIDLSVRRNAFGRQLESFEADLAVAGLHGGPMHAVFIRAPIVEGGHRSSARVDVLDAVGSVPRGIGLRRQPERAGATDGRRLPPGTCDRGGVPPRARRRRAAAPAAVADDIEGD